MIFFEHHALDNELKATLTILHEKQPGRQSSIHEVTRAKEAVYAINSLYLVCNAHNHISTCRWSYQAPISMLSTREFAPGQTTTSQLNELLGLESSSIQVGEPSASLVPLGVAGPLCTSGTSFHSPSSSLSVCTRSGVGALSVTSGPSCVASLLCGRLSLSVASVA